MTAAAALQLDLQFKLWGRPATYSAPSGSTPAACLIVVARPDQVVGVEDLQLMRAAQIVKVRASEISAPAEGGVFLREDGASFRIIGQPRRAADRTLWICGAK